MYNIFAQSFAILFSRRWPFIWFHCLFTFGTKPFYLVVTPYVLWYDLWIGIYYSKGKKTLYIQLLPMVGVSFQILLNGDAQYLRRRSSDRF